MITFMVLSACIWISANEFAARSDGDGDGAPWNEDCDDADASRAPGQAEICNNGRDDDCSSELSVCYPHDVGAALHALTPSVTHDSFADDVAWVGDYVGGGSNLVAVTGRLSDGTRVVDWFDLSETEGPPSRGSWLIATLSATRGPVDVGILAAGDMSLDGTQDIFLGAPDAFGCEPNEELAGRIWLWDGPDGHTTLDGAICGGNAEDRLGVSLAALGNFGGEGPPVVGAGWPTQATVALFSASNRFVGGLAADGTAIYDRRGSTTFGRTVASAGDLNGDGFSDALVAGCDADDALDCGVYVLMGPVIERRLEVDVTDRRGDNIRGSDFGSGLDGGKDVDADGYSDFVVAAAGGAFPGSARGSAYVFLGDAAGGTSWSARIDGGTDNDGRDMQVALVADLDEDGGAELAIGMPDAAGGAGVFALTASPLNDAIVDGLDVFVAGLAPGDRLGERLDSSPVSGQGVAVTAPGASAVYVFTLGL